LGVSSDEPGEQPIDEPNQPKPVFAGFTKPQLQLLAIGAVAMLLPLLFIIIIFVINFGG
jgi:hypothetical protein